MSHYLLTGILLGLAAGFAPGPLLTLVVSETLQHDVKAGIKVAFAPIITDLPIILLTLFILSKLSNFNYVLGIISFVGGFFILFMGYKSIGTTGVSLSEDKVKPNSLLKGMLVNALSPHPYLFWVSVGAPIMTKAMNLNVFAPLAFIVSFYFFLVGTKIVLALLVGHSKSFLKENMYIYSLRFLGMVLCLFSVVLFYDGLKLFEII
ncbi:MAG: LysE family transporter [Gammaproteobacteria bacterium]|nr:LysE family transporter [Gammaproteobacteria bacterium]